MELIGQDNVLLRGGCDAVDQSYVVFISFAKKKGSGFIVKNRNSFWTKTIAALMTLVLLTGVLTPMSPAIAAETPASLANPLVEVTNASVGEPGKEIWPFVPHIAPNSDFYIFKSHDTILEKGETKVTLRLECPETGYIFRAETTSSARLSDVEVNDFISKLNMGTAYTNLERDTNLKENLRILGMPDAFSDELVNGKSRQAFVNQYFYVVRVPKVSPEGVPLREGTYNFSVTITNSAYPTTNYNDKIEVSYTQEKACGRFWPTEHKANLDGWSRERGWRVFNAPFAGFWSPSEAFDLKHLNPKDPFAFGKAVLPETSKGQNILEYSVGNAHLITYNIVERCPTYNAEIGEFQRRQAIDKPDKTGQLFPYYYALGEPYPLNGQSPQLVPFPYKKFSGDISGNTDREKLAITRIDFLDKMPEEQNRLDINSLSKLKFTTIKDGVTLRAGEHLTVNGVVAPIQNKVSEVHYNVGNNFWYTMDNKIEAIKYYIEYENGHEMRLKALPLGLLRSGGEFDPAVHTDAYSINGAGLNGPSIFEFRHTLVLAYDLGDIHIAMVPIDSHGLERFDLAQGFQVTIMP